MKIRSLKTCLGYALSTFIFTGVVFAIIILIICLVEGMARHEVIICVSVLIGWILIGVLIFLLPCIFSRRKYIITDSHIEMHLKGKLIYRIGRDKIIEIRFYKIAWYLWLPIALMTIFFTLISLGGAIGMDDMCNKLSIRFKEYEVWQKSYRDFFGENFETLTSEEEKAGLFEIADNFSILEVKRICKFLNIKPQIIKIKK